MADCVRLRKVKFFHTFTIYLQERMVSLGQNFMSPTTLLSQQLPSLSYTSTPDRFDETWSAPLSTLLGLGRSAGADLVEFFLERTNYINCLAEDDAITSITPSLAIGAGVRVFRGQADCYVSTNDL